MANGKEKWVELGFGTLINTKKFSAFSLHHFDDRSFIYGVTNGHKQTIYVAGRDETIIQFKKLRGACIAASNCSNIRDTENQG